MGSGLVAQSGQEKSHTVISIEISESDYKKLHKPRTSDLEFDEPTIVVGGTAAEVQSLRTRGKSSLKQYRKSFTVELEDRVCIEFKQAVDTGYCRMCVPLTISRNQADLLSAL